MNLLLFHGYGVRGWFWDRFRDALAANGLEAQAPDLDFSTVTAAIDDARRRVEAANAEAGPVTLIGHSMGAVLSAITARDLGPQVIERAILIAPPWGERGSTPPLVTWLIRRRLLPGFLIRGRFFGRHTERAEQVRIFGKAVPESEALMDAVFAPRWFHVPLLPGRIAGNVTVVASEGDRVVPAGQSRAMAERIGARFHLIPAAEGVGHNDFATSVTVAENLIADFVVS